MSQWSKRASAMVEERHTWKKSSSFGFGDTNTTLRNSEIISGTKRMVQRPENAVAVRDLIASIRDFKTGGNIPRKALAFGKLLFFVGSIQNTSGTFGPPMRLHQCSITSVVQKIASSCATGRNSTKHAWRSSFLTPSFFVVLSLSSILVTLMTTNRFRYSLGIVLLEISVDYLHPICRARNTSWITIVNPITTSTLQDLESNSEFI